MTDLAECLIEVERLRKELREERDYRAACEADLEHLWLAIEKIMEENR